MERILFFVLCCTDIMQLLTPCVKFGVLFFHFLFRQSSVEYIPVYSITVYHLNNTQYIISNNSTPLSTHSEGLL
jgi:hypothetical protein